MFVRLDLILAVSAPLNQLRPEATNFSPPLALPTDAGVGRALSALAEFEETPFDERIILPFRCTLPQLLENHLESTGTRLFVGCGAELLLPTSTKAKASHPRNRLPCELVSS